MKRIIALLTTMFMALFALTAFAQGFSDMPDKSDPNYAAVEFAVNNKILTGADGKLSLDNPVTLAETLTFISRVKPFGTQSADLSSVTDISASDWYYATFAQAVAAGFVTPDSENKLNPTKVLTAQEAWSYINKALGNNSATLSSGGDKTATRENVVTYLYDLRPTENATDPTTPTEAPTTAPLEFSDLKSQAAQEAMQLALGILPDGTNYTTVSAYRDQNSTDWASGKVTGSSRPSGGSSSGGSSSDDDPDDGESTRPTEAPTEPSVQEPTEPPTQAPTEPETQEPTEPAYGDYDGPIDNDKDNVIDDPFNDGWTPPGFGGGSTGGSGSGGYDEEDEDFIVDDADDPALLPTEGSTEAPTEEETEPSTEESTDAPTEEETDPSTDESTEDESEDSTEDSTDEVVDKPTDEETEPSTEESTNAPTEEETDPSTEDSPEDPSEDLDDSATNVPEDEETEDTSSEDSENSTEDSSTDEDEDSEAASIFSKDWWFD